MSDTKRERGVCVKVREMSSCYIERDAERERGGCWIRIWIELLEFKLEVVINYSCTHGEIENLDMADKTWTRMGIKTKYIPFDDYYCTIMNTNTSCFWSAIEYYLLNSLNRPHMQYKSITPSQDWVKLGIVQIFPSFESDSIWPHHHLSTHLKTLI